MSPQLHVDAHFVPGRDHTVCEDYALARARVAVVSDGCSASPHTDVGARLVAHAAAASPSEAVRGEVCWLEQADCARRSLELPPAALDCTCAVGVAGATGIDVALFGDGVVVAQRADGTTEFHEVVFDSGAPAYPSYGLCPQRDRSYREAGLSARRIESRLLADEAALPPTAPLDTGPAVRWHFPRESYTAVFFGSDGLCAFADRANARVPLVDVLPLVLRIPAPRGAFVQRRLRRLVSRDATARGWRARDDVSLAALCWAREEAE